MNLFSESTDDCLPHD